MNKFSFTQHVLLLLGNWAKTFAVVVIFMSKFPAVLLKAIPIPKKTDKNSTNYMEDQDLENQPSFSIPYKNLRVHLPFEALNRK